MSERVHPYSGAPMRMFAYACSKPACGYVRAYWMTWTMYRHSKTAPHNCACGAPLYRAPETWSARVTNPPEFPWSRTCDF